MARLKLSREGGDIWLREAKNESVDLDEGWNFRFGPETNEGTASSYNDGSSVASCSTIKYLRVENWAPFLSRWERFEPTDGV